MRAALVLVLCLMLPGCLSYKIVRVCLPTADGKAVVVGPHTLFWGMATGTIELTGPAMYESVPVSATGDRQILWRRVPDAGCTIRE